MGGALTAFQKTAFRSPPSKAAASDDTTTVTAGHQATASGADQPIVSTVTAVVAPAEGSAVGSNGDNGARFSIGDPDDPSQIADTVRKAAANGDIPNAASAAVLPGSVGAGRATTTTASSARHRKPNALGSRGRFSTISRVVKSFPRNGNGRGERVPDGPEESAAADAAAANSAAGREEATGAGQAQELTPTQAAVLAADNKLEGLLNVGGILRARSGWEFPHGFPQGTPIWDSTAEAVGSGNGTGSGDRVAQGVGVGVSGGGCDSADGLGDVAGKDFCKSVMRWASRFCDNGTRFPAASSEEGARLGRALAKHVVRDRDAGLIGTR